MRHTAPVSTSAALLIALAATSCFKTTTWVEPRARPADRGEDDAAPGEPAATPEEEREALWARTVAFVDDPSHRASARLRQLELFSFLHPTGHPHVEEMESRILGLREEAAAEAERRAVYTEAGRAAWLRSEGAAEDAAAAANQRALRQADPPLLLALFVYEGWERKAAGFDPLEVHLPDGRARTIEGPFAGATGSLRDMGYAVVDAAAPDLLAPHSREVPWDVRYNHAVNGLLEPIAGGPLFDKRPGRVNRKALKALIDAADVRLKTPLLGTTVQALRPWYGPTVEEHLAVLEALDDWPGRDRARGAFREARRRLARHEDGYNEPMMAWYADIAESWKVGPRAGVPRADHATVICGFWLRRLDDNTADLVEAELEKLAAEP